MVDVFDEVESELRKERYETLLRRYGPWAAAIALVIIVGVGGYQIWSAWRAGLERAASEAYAEALAAAEAGDVQTAVARFQALAGEAPPGVAGLARLQAGGLAARTGDAAAAAAAFEAAADAADPLLREAAIYQGALTVWNDLSYEDARARLEPLAAPGAPFRPAARELIAAAALEAARWDEARRIYDSIGLSLDAVDGPPGVQRRAREALAYINQRGVVEDPPGAGAQSEAGVPAGEGATETAQEGSGVWPDEDMQGDGGDL